MLLTGKLWQRASEEEEGRFEHFKYFWGRGIPYERELRKDYLFEGVYCYE